VSASNLDGPLLRLGVSSGPPSSRTKNNRGARWSIRWVFASRTAGFTFLHFSLSTELGAELRFRAGQRPLKPARWEAIPQTSEQFFFVGVSGLLHSRQRERRAAWAASDALGTRL